jgi:phosphatidylglycerol---prolipoprotein diacylglyceryl transferase
MIPYLHLNLALPRSAHLRLMLWLAAVAAAFVMDRNFKPRAHRLDAGGNSGHGGRCRGAGIVGAKLWHVLDTPMEFRELGWRVLWDTAGFAWFGGLLFGISALVFQGWWAKIGALRTLDLAAPARPSAMASGASAAFSPATAATESRSSRFIFSYLHSGPGA